MIYAMKTVEACILRQEKRRSQSSTAYELLLYGMNREFGCTALPQIEKTKSGKPFFSEWKEIHFNLSHCSKGIICGIHNASIGVDMEAIISYREKLAQRICHPNELALLHEAEQMQKEYLLTRMWVLKEAFLKYEGTGINRDLRSMDYSCCQSDVLTMDGLSYQICQKQDCCIAVCSQREINKILWIEEEELLHF